VQIVIEGDTVVLEVNSMSGTLKGHSSKPVLFGSTEQYDFTVNIKPRGLTLHLFFN
jgi:hypothetical protein